MGLVHSPNTVMSGLTLCLDAANPVSYPGANVSISLSQVEYLVIAGGGGGGNQDAFGGGGAGGYRSSVAGESSGGGASAESPLAVSPGSYTVTVGLGGLPGDPGARGGDSVFGPITSIGGGGGGGSYPSLTSRNGTTGGSGGGGSGSGPSVNPGIPGSAGTVGQGFAGGSGRSDESTFRNAGGGGGAGGVGGSGSTSNATGGTGGPGVASSITGTAVTRGGGGAGGQAAGTAGGSGGGGAFNVSGTANTGGGGGGAGGSGGSGIVIIRYPILYTGPQQATGGNTVTTAGGYTVHTFTASGVFTVTTVVYPTWRDVSGQNNYGILVNSPTFNSANSGSIVFNGTNQYVAGSIATVNSWSMCLWYLSTDITSQAVFYPFSGTTTATGLGFGGTSSVDSINRWYFFDGTNVFSSPNTAVTTNVWYNLVVTKSSTTYSLYTNGTLSLTGTGVDLALTQYNLGRRGNGEWYAQGNIAQASIYNRALTAEEVNQNFQALRGRFGI
jgi:hypothetical protein